MKKHNALKVVIITLLVFVLLTWFIPCAIYQSSYSEVGRYQVGIFDVAAYQSTVLGYFGYVALFVLVIGGFYGVLYKTGVYRKILDGICKKLKGKETIAIIVMMSLLAILTSLTGFQVVLLMLFPFVISLVLMMGYNKKAAVLATAGSVSVGLMGTTFAYNTTQVLQQVLSVKAVDLIWAKIILLVLGLVILSFYLFKLGKDESTKKCEDKDLFIPEASKGKDKKKVWPLMVILDVMFVIGVLAFIPWNSAFSIDAFEKATDAFLKFEVFKFPIFGKIFGSVNAFGSWSFLELITLMLVAIIIIKFVYKIKWDDIFDGFGNGVKKAMLPAFLILLIYTCIVLTTYNPFQLVIYKVILGMSKGFNIFTTFLVALFASIFNGDPLYAFNSVLPYMVSVIKSSSNYQLIAVIFQAIFGIVTLVAPTSIPLMLTLAYTDVSFKDWFKYIWKVLVALLVLAFIIFTILILI